MHGPLSLAREHRTSADVPDLFDHRLRSLRRDRAIRTGIETFLYDRAFNDCLERLAVIHGDFSNVLLAGCPNPQWPKQLSPRTIAVIDPGPLMAQQAGGECADLETLPFEARQFDLVITIGMLDTANNLPLAAAALELVLKPGGLLLGALAGGDSIPRLRSALLAADSAAGQAAPHVHPRIEAAALGNLLSAAGFLQPVVDVDRVELSYPSIDRLVDDLRAMGSTNVLNSRARRPLTRRAMDAARSAFLEGEDRATEKVEILHFAAWKAS